MRTNKVKLDVDFKEFNARYQIWRIETTNKWFKNGAALLDSAEFGQRIRSALISSGSRAYVLFDAGDDARCMLSDAIKAADDSSLSIAKEAPDNLPQAMLFNLMLNSLSAPWHEKLRFNNITGHLYCVNEAHVKARGDKVNQVNAIEVSVDTQMHVGLKVKTFSPLRLKALFGASKRDPETLPRYVLRASSTMRRTFDKHDDDLVIRQVRGKKATIPFLDIGSRRKFEASKMGCLFAVTELFREKYDEVAKLGFLDFNELARIKTRMNLKWHMELRDIIGQDRIVVVDCVESEDSGALCQAVASYICSRFELVATVVEKPKSDELAILLIHEKETYDNDSGEDPYRLPASNQITQHVTMESLPDEQSFTACVVIDSCVKELAIKRDVVRERLSVVDWSELMAGHRMTFGIRVPRENVDLFCFLTIDALGGMTFASKQWDPEDSSLYGKLIEAFDEKAEMMVVSDAGDINLILGTDLYAIPDYEEVARLFSEEGHVNRRKEVYDTFLKESVNICFAQTSDSSGMYYVGQVGSNINQKIPRAARIREVVAAPGSDLFFKDVLFLMDVDFVRAKMLTVVPFPFKHLREWMRMKGIE